jgi:hypothetical protein
MFLISSFFHVGRVLKHPGQTTIVENAFFLPFMD